MILLIVAVALFAAVHLLSAVPSTKARLAAKVGPAFPPVFIAALVLSLLLVVLAWRRAPFIAVYDPPDWGWYATFLLVMAGFLFLGIFIFRGTFRQRLRFPLAMGVMAWSAGHLLSNGDAAAIVLFGGLFLYGAAHLALGLANGIRPSPEVRQGHDMISLLIGLALFGAAIQIHRVYTGVPVLVLTH